MVLNKGGKYIPTITYTLISAYRISSFVINNGDLI